MITEEFNKKFAEFVTEPEGGEKLKIYDDGYGVPTIGIGFALINKVPDGWQAYSEKFLKERGIKLTSDQYQIIVDYADAKSRGRDTSHLKKQLENLDFTIDTTISQSLLEYSINQKYKEIKEQIGEECWDQLNLARQIGVMDHAFQKGNISALKESLIAGDYVQTAKIMRNAQPAWKDRAELRADFVECGEMEFKGIYIVKRKDTFGTIAKAHNMSAEELRTLNPNVNDPNKISVLQKINVASCDHHVLEIIYSVQRLSGNNTEQLSTEFSIENFVVRVKEDNKATKYIGQSPIDLNILQRKTKLTDAEEKKMIGNFKSIQRADNNTFIHTKALDLTKDQYNKILAYIDSQIESGHAKQLQDQTHNQDTSSRTEYYAMTGCINPVINNCINHPLQLIYNAAGFPLYFYMIYSLEELNNIQNMVSSNVTVPYIKKETILPGISFNKELKTTVEDVASRLNMPVNKVSKVATMSEVNDEFNIIVDEELFTSIKEKLYPSIKSPCIASQYFNSDQPNTSSTESNNVIELLSAKPELNSQIQTTAIDQDSVSALTTPSVDLGLAHHKHSHHHGENSSHHIVRRDNVLGNKHAPESLPSLSSDDSGINSVSKNYEVDVNSTLTLADVVMRMMTGEKYHRKLVVNNNVEINENVNREYASKLAYSAYVPKGQVVNSNESNLNVLENHTQDIELLGGS